MALGSSSPLLINIILNEPSPRHTSITFTPTAQCHNDVNVTVHNLKVTARLRSLFTMSGSQYWSRSQHCQGRGNVKVAAMSRSRQGQGRGNVKVAAMSRSRQGQGHGKVKATERSRPWKGQGHGKVKVTAM